MVSKQNMITPSVGIGIYTKRLHWEIEQGQLGKLYPVTEYINRSDFVCIHSNVGSGINIGHIVYNAIVRQC